VTFRYRDYIGWNTGTSNIISHLISLMFMLGLTPHPRFGPTGTPQN